ncbi:glycosyl hydrolase family 18 protein [Microcoleus sp. AT9b-C3]|uniref:glycosyl hydrolase family 18 protein n=1 Tax=Microcoleus sp. AT9b-C3 TaxID=2818629 RepID=UPI002FD2E3DE
MAVQNSLLLLVNKSMQTTLKTLQQFARDEFIFRNSISIAFGEEIDERELQLTFSNGNFTNLPSVKICSTTEINGASGAYSADTGKIYLAQEFIEANIDNPQAVVNVLLEEIGHYIDAKINLTDAAGDEGDIFARLVQGKSLSQQELEVLRAEDDTATVMLDGQMIGIEQNSVIPKGVRYNEYAFLTTHNSHVTLPDGWLSANQRQTITQQLADGVRGLMLDTYYKEPGSGDVFKVIPEPGVYLLHGVDKLGWIAGATYPSRPTKRLHQTLNEIVDFLNQNPSEIVTIFLEDYTTKENLEQELEKVPNINNLLFDPDYDDPNTILINENIESAKQWPLISEMVKENKRLLIFSGREDNGTLSGVAYDRKYIIQNVYENDGLQSRWDNGIYKYKSYPKLYVFNHFGIQAPSVLPDMVSSEIDNDFNKIKKRIEDGLDSGNNQKPNQLPNFVTVDFYDTFGYETKQVVDYLNNTYDFRTKKKLHSHLVSSSDAPDRDYVIGGYFPEWGIYGRDFQVEDIPADKLTHLFYSFAQIDQNGEVAIFDTWAATQTPFLNEATGEAKYTYEQSQANEAGNFAELQKLKAANPHLHLMLSIGGWSLSGPFSTVASTEVSREKFAQSAVEFMVEYGFDGLDIDWEYPGEGGASLAEVETLAPNRLNKEVNDSSDDKHNYTLLLAELDEQIKIQEVTDGRDYQLSIASPAGLENIENIELQEVSKYIDFFNLMAYDFHGSTWEPNTTNHQAALFANPNAPSAAEIVDTLNIHSAVEAYLQAGVDPQDIILGAPLYGRAWSGVSNSSSNGGLFQSATGAATGTWENGVLDYDDLYNRLETQPENYTRYWDDEAKVPYIYSPIVEGGFFSTYEDSQSIELKTNYIKNMGLGGMFFWDVSSDLPSSHNESLINHAHEYLT